MFQSRVVEVSGVFLGAAIPTDTALRFVAVDPRVEELDGSVWHTMDDLRRVAGHLLAQGRLPRGGQPVSCQPLS